MASLELLIEPGGLLQGGAVTRSALDQIIAKGGQAEDAMDRIGETMTVAGASAQEAFGAAKGGLKITQGLQAVAGGFVAATNGAKDFSSVAQGAAGFLLNISRTKDEWVNLSRAMETTTTVSKEVVRDQFGIAVGMRDVVTSARSGTSGIGVLWGVLKANPVSAIATGIGLAATAMSLFSSRTEEAKNQFSSFAAEFEKSRLEASISRAFGRSGGPGARGQQDLLFRTAVDTRRSAERKDGETESEYRARTFVSVDAFAKGVGVGRDDVLQWLATQSETVSKLPDQALGFALLSSDPLIRAAAEASSYVRSGNTSGDKPGAISLTPDLQYSFYESRYRNLGPQAAYEAQLDAYQRGAPQPGIYSIGASGPEQYGPPLDDAAKASISFQEEQQRAAEESMQRMLDQANRFGQTIGDAFFLAASGAQKLRQSFAQIVGDFARLGAQKAFGALFESVAGGFGRTNTQLAKPGGD